MKVAGLVIVFDSEIFFCYIIRINLSNSLGILRWE